jgi:hypothetical protein
MQRDLIRVLVKRVEIDREDITVVLRVTPAPGGPGSPNPASVTGLRLSIPFERDVFIFAVPCQFYCSAGLPFSCPGLRFVQALCATCGPPGRSTLPNRLTQTATKYGVANPCRKDLSIYG